VLPEDSPRPGAAQSDRGRGGRGGCQEDKHSPRSRDADGPGPPRLGWAGPAGFDRGSWRISMQAFGMLLLAAATAGGGFGYGEPGVRLKKWLRPHVVTSGEAPGPPMYTAASAGMGGPTGAGPGRRFVSTRSQIHFLDPDGMQIGWQTGAGPNGER